MYNGGEFQFSGCNYPRRKEHLENSIQKRKVTSKFEATLYLKGMRPLKERGQL